MEFKDNQGKAVEDTILNARREMKDKRNTIKDLTNRINAAKKKIDHLKSALDRKEDDRKQEKLNADNFDDEEQEEIIDEEELNMLREMKDLKRDYRDNFSGLKALKQECQSLTENIDAAKEQLIFQFEEWYASEFEVGDQPVPELNIKQID